MPIPPPAAALPQREWLLTNRHGSFAFGCADRRPRRKYHTLLTVRHANGGDPLNLVAEVGEAVVVGDQVSLLHSFDYQGWIHPKGYRHLAAFDASPSPCWRYEVGGLRLERRLSLAPGADVLRLDYRLTGVTGAVSAAPVTVYLRPFLLCRPWHATMEENPFLDGEARPEDGGISLQLYPDVPRLGLAVRGHAATFGIRGAWNKGIHYSTEAGRGYAATEDYYHPGAFRLDVGGSAEWSLSIGLLAAAGAGADAEDAATAVAFDTPCDRTPCDRLWRAGRQFLIEHHDGGAGIVAGYPWYGQRPRDTLTALPGLLLEPETGPSDGTPIDVGPTGAHQAVRILDDIAASLMSVWCPGRRPAPADIVPSPVRGVETIDVMLRFVHAVRQAEARVGGGVAERFMPAVLGLVEAVASGADPRVRLTRDGGLFVEPGPWAATWMDVALAGWPVTPRHGFAVELNALWLNALDAIVRWADATGRDDVAARWAPRLEIGTSAFVDRFWSESRGYLADAHDGIAADFTLRPNQLWAIGLPYSPLSPASARRCLAHVRAALLTPVGLRTLAPDDPRYRGRYRGDPAARDAAFHQGTVWPWLLGIYTDAVARAEGRAAMRAEIEPIVDRLRRHLDEACLGQISEVFDGDPPHDPGGAPAFAASVAEVRRVARKVDDPSPDALLVHEREAHMNREAAGLVEA